MNFDNYTKVFENVDWNIIIDISLFWNKYSNGELNISDFCKQYKQVILSKKDDIVVKLGQDSWNKLEVLLPKLDSVVTVEESYSIFDDIYDWADNNEVLIKTNTENEEF